MQYEEKSEWAWCADWCKSKGLSPWQSKNWERALQDYQEHLTNKEEKTQ